jgi:hypothetical protein
LESIKVFKSKSNIDMFKDGKIGVLQIKRKYIYKDEKLTNVVGPSEANIVILFDTTTKRYYQYDADGKPEIPK